MEMVLLFPKKSASVVCALIGLKLGLVQANVIFVAPDCIPTFFNKSVTKTLDPLKTCLPSPLVQEAKWLGSAFISAIVKLAGLSTLPPIVSLTTFWGTLLIHCPQG